MILIKDSITNQSVPMCWHFENVLSLLIAQISFIPIITNTYGQSWF